jgi:predicted ATPase
MAEKGPRVVRICLTGGPGGGKTTAGDLLRRELGKRVAFVPEAATVLFTGGFPRYKEESCVAFQQQAIYHVQTNLEASQAAKYPGRMLLCDRGTADGLAYWRGSEAEWSEAMGGTSLEAELRRYDVVIFFQSAAVLDASDGAAGTVNTMLEGGNPARNETVAEARHLDTTLEKIWRQHPRFFLVQSQGSFFEKLSEAVRICTSVVRELEAVQT